MSPSKFLSLSEALNLSNNSQTPFNGRGLRNVNIQNMNVYKIDLVDNRIASQILELDLSHNRITSL